MLHVQLFRSHRRLYGGTAAQIVLPGLAGEVTVLYCHVPMLCALMEGDVQIDEVRFPVRRGLARVDRNVVTILAV